MSPYTKTANRWTGNWDIEDGDGEVIATVQTETMADGMMAFLLGMYPKPEVGAFVVGEPYGEENGGEQVQVQVRDHQE